MAGRYPSKAVANWLIDRFAADGDQMTQLQLYKLVYVAHGWHLAQHTGEGLVAETIHAWKYGPVVPSLREEFRDYGAKPIDTKAVEWLTFEDFTVPSLQEHNVAHWEEELLEWVYEKYGHLSGPQLIAITHKVGTPWDKVTKGGTHIPPNLRIPNDMIRDFYKSLLRRSDQ